MKYLIFFLISFNLYALDFADVQEQIFDAKCVMCHSGPFAPIGLNLSTYDSVITNPPFQVVVKGDPENSILYNAVLSGRMPARGIRLNQDELKLMYDWIEAGAPEFEE
jgi:uncharacterized membrane protein